MVNIIATVDELGDSPEEIAYNLLRQGIRGQVAGAFKCPISKYLKKRTGLSLAVSSYGYVRTDDPQCMDPGQLNPPAVYFIKAFDTGKFAILGSNAARRAVIAMELDETKRSQENAQAADQV